MRIRRAFGIWAMASLVVAVAACGAAPVEAPADTGVCWEVTRFKPKVGFISLSQGDPNLETCAMHLEYTRLIHRLPSIAGGYQGQFLFIDADTIASAKDLESNHYSLFTPAQRKDLDGKIRQLIQMKSKKPAV